MTSSKRVPRLSIFFIFYNSNIQYDKKVFFVFNFSIRCKSSIFSWFFFSSQLLCGLHGIFTSIYILIFHVLAFRFLYIYSSIFSFWHVTVIVIGRFKLYWFCYFIDVGVQNNKILINSIIVFNFSLFIFTIDALYSYSLTALLTIFRSNRHYW